MTGDRIDRGGLPSLNPHSCGDDTNYSGINDKEINPNGVNQFFRNVVLRTKIYSCFNCKNKKTSIGKRYRVPVNCDVETYEDPSLSSSSVSEEPTTPSHGRKSPDLTEDIPKTRLAPEADHSNGSNIKHSESKYRLLEPSKGKVQQEEKGQNATLGPIRFGKDLLPSFLNQQDDDFQPSSDQKVGLIPPLNKQHSKTHGNAPSSSTNHELNPEICDLSAVIPQGQELSQETNNRLIPDLNMDDDTLQEDVNDRRPDVTFMCSQEGANIEALELTWKILAQNRKSRLKNKSKLQLKFKKVRRRAQLVFIIILSTSTIYYCFLNKNSISQSHTTQYNNNELNMDTNGTALKRKVYPMFSKKTSTGEECQKDVLYLSHQDRAKVCIENMNGHI